MVINEDKIKKIVKKVIKEILDKDFMSPVYRRINNGDQTKTFKMAEKPSVFKDGWLLHFTSYDNALDIMRNGFKHSMSRKEIDNIFWRPDTRNRDDEGYAFGYDPYTSFDLDLARRSYGGTIIMFKAHGIKFFHNIDGEWEVVFKNTVAHDFVLLTRDYETGKYMVGNRGNGNSLYEGIFYDVVKWVINNYEQYRGSLKDVIPAKCCTRINRNERAQELGIDLETYLRKMQLGRYRYKEGILHFSKEIERYNQEAENIIDNLLRSDAYVLKNGNMRSREMYENFIDDYSDCYEEEELNDKVIMFSNALNYLIQDYGRDSINNDILNIKKRINDRYWDICDDIKSYINVTGKKCLPLYCHIDYPYLGSYEDIEKKMEAK